jgi:hypothetical protein
MKDLRQLLHEELDRIFDELSKRVDINNSDIYLDINADEFTNIYTYNHVVVDSALGSDLYNNWEILDHSWRKDVVSLDTGETVSSEYGEW